MKYFTREIWAGWQGDGAVFDLAMKDWKTNLRRYKASLRRLVPRLASRSRKFFTDHSLHDGHLLRFSISDRPRASVRVRQPGCETSVSFAVLAGTKRATIYFLSYAGVKEVTVATRNDLFSLADSRFGDWGYDELLPEGRHAFRHNILFQTGTEISIAFQRFSFRTHIATPGALKRVTSNQGVQ